MIEVNMDDYQWGYIFTSISQTGGTNFRSGFLFVSKENFDVFEIILVLRENEFLFFF